ncbi:hypothetical protein AVANS14531_00110 [Campylobacter sp. Cr9]|uniref:hypothetical protein n=1 Tax=unclassified Campylobacter TaxID=2593542 RepID=UPI001EFA9132|nr:hypothetical protein [Campylobacter sp. RM5004]MBZ7984743.1 hypothetical protein [Campylobacter sp. Cr9]
MQKLKSELKNSIKLSKKEAVKNTLTKAKAKKIKAILASDLLRQIAPIRLRISTSI